MKIIDCFMYFDEDLVLDLRLNTLADKVAFFVICEASYNHNGKKKKFRFDINKFSKFKDKIIYIPLEEQPLNLHKINLSDNDNIKNSKILDNSLYRENFQRNYIQKKLNDFHDEDLILINDLDEIPNLDNFRYRKKITFFEQKMFYYKFNLVYPNFTWIGSKICKKKHLITPQWLRNIKSRKYPFWRLDIIFSDKKYHNVDFVKDGGWHFTNIKNAEDIDHKMKNFLHHLEYEKSGLSLENLKKMIEEKKVMYDHSVDQRKNKWGSSATLEKIEINLLPSYINLNKDKFNKWLD